MRFLPTRLRNILIAILLITLVGTTGFKIIGGAKTSLLDALYMTTITLFTVGYSDVIGLDDKPAGKIFAIIFIYVGAGTIAFLFTNLAAYMIGGELRTLFRRRAMDKRIARTKKHYIVCGIGMVGLYIVQELHHTKRPLIAIDLDEQALETLRADNLHINTIAGDASENAILQQAMIDHAQGLFATTDSDNANIVIVLTAKQLNPSLRVVSRCNDTRNLDKIRRAGADSVVALDYIGGLRMASEMVRPHVTTFLDRMLRDRESPMRVEEVQVPRHSPYISRPVGEIDFKTVGNILLVAVRTHDGSWIYNPYPDAVIERDMSLIVMSNPEARETLEMILSQGGTPKRAG
jgi:voltage-gated potassium channel